MNGTQITYHAVLDCNRTRQIQLKNCLSLVAPLTFHSQKALKNA